MKKIGLVVLVLTLLLITGCGKKEEKIVKKITVPYAITDISPRTKITSDMIGTKKVAVDELDNVYTKVEDIIGKYVTDKYNVNFKISKGDLFKKNDIVELEDLPDPLITQYPDDHILVYTNIYMDRTYGDMIYPGDYIDIYLKAFGNEIVIGKLVENVRVLDSEDICADVALCKNLNEVQAKITFAVPEEINDLLHKVANIKDYSVTMIAVPTDKKPVNLEISNVDIKSFIEHAN